VTVPVHHVVLAITAAAVLALALYVFVQVRATSAQAMPQPAVVAHVTPPSEPAAEPQHALPARTQARPVAVAPVAAPSPPSAAPHDEPAEDQPFDVDEAMRTNVKLELVMDQANKAYDRQDYYQAKQIASRVLAKQPGSTRMIRIMVSASCMDGDLAVANKYYAMLPMNDRVQMKRRCDANGATLQEPPP
jgi:hypothetical protein